MKPELHVILTPKPRLFHNTLPPSDKEMCPLTKLTYNNKLYPGAKHFHDNCIHYAWVFCASPHVHQSQVLLRYLHNVVYACLWGLVLQSLRFLHLIPITFLFFLNSLSVIPISLFLASLYYLEKLHWYLPVTISFVPSPKSFLS